MIQPACLDGGQTQVHLTGFMASGKTTISKLVARRLLWNFLDLDAVIERHAGRKVSEVFAAEGEDGFRAMERHVLRQVLGKPATVVALGGGTLIEHANRELCAAAAAVVWLRLPLAVIEGRCDDDPKRRPLWGDAEELQRRFNERLAGYESADHVVDAEGDAEVVAERVVRVLGVVGGA